MPSHLPQPSSSQIPANPFGTLQKLPGSLGSKKLFYSLPALESHFPNLRRLPVSIRLMLEALLRHCDGERITQEDIERLATWKAKKPGDFDVPFVVARVILQDFTGVPLLVDLAAMRDAAASKGFEAKQIEPLVPVDLVIDHSVQVDKAGSKEAFSANLALEFKRNRERYEFLKWGQEAFKTFRVVPPGIGIVHQVNLEYLGKVVLEKEGVLFPDTLVGTDSHTTMINGLGILGWGVGGIEAEAAMLGLPVAMQVPEVVGVHLTGALREGVTATDFTLRVTELLRETKVVGKFVEFFGEGAASLSVADRATVANMAPEYGATVGFFPFDEESQRYLKMTGRSQEEVALMSAYLKAQNLFGMPRQGEIDYTEVVSLDLGSVVPSVAGPKRPQDRIPLPELKGKLHALLSQLSPLLQRAPHQAGGSEELTDERAERDEVEMVLNRPFTSEEVHYAAKGAEELTHGSVVIAAITSCTNTSNPAVMVGAALLAKKAVERGLKVARTVKTSLAPGSRVVTDYLERSGLQQFLDLLGFNCVAYGCTTCIGNSGPLDEKIEEAIQKKGLIVASVLSGNRNFEARIHSAVKANFLMSPPLVVAFALAGKVDIDFEHEPLGVDGEGKGVFLREIWPSQGEVEEVIRKGITPEMFRERYASVFTGNEVWNKIEIKKGEQYAWEEKSSYIRKPPYLEGFCLEKREFKPLNALRCLSLFGDSVTTDHISPAGAFNEASSAGKYLKSLGISPKEFNSYGSRRGNHEVMMRGTFANVRLRNFLAEKEGGWTRLMPEGKEVEIFEAAKVYRERGEGLILFAGKDYGMGSSRDWAAKGPQLLGVRVVVAESIERIHRSNLIGMGILPLQFREGEGWKSLGITGSELFSIEGELKPQGEVVLRIETKTEERAVPLKVRLDTAVEAKYFERGGIMPYVLQKLLKGGACGV